MSTATAKKRTQSNNTARGTSKPAIRSNASQKGGKSGSTRRQPVNFSKAELAHMQKLKAMGISMTNIARIIGEKHPNARYYDVYKQFYK